MNEIVPTAQIETDAEELSGAHPLFAGAPRSVAFNKLRKRLVRNVREAIDKFGMARPGEKWLVAISGGEHEYTLAGFRDALALKAQAQCRATLEALAEIKNPRPVSFVKQANIANGPQQVNNGSTHAGTHAHAEKSTGTKNELLEHQHGNYLDAGAQGTAGGADTHLEAVGAGQRAAHA